MSIYPDDEKFFGQPRADIHREIELIRGGAKEYAKTMTSDAQMLLESSGDDPKTRSLVQQMLNRAKFALTGKV